MKKLLRLGFVVFVLLFIGLSAFSVYYVRPGRGPSETIDPVKNGYVEYVGGIRVVHLKGSPYEMGYQHGALLKTDVQKGAEAFGGLLDSAAKDLKLSFAGRQIHVPREGLEIVLDVVYRRCSAWFPARYARELEGMADGSGVPLQTLRRMQVVSELSERACSEFAVFGAATTGGKLYHGHNFDWSMDAGLQQNAALFLLEPDGMVPFAAAGYVGMLGYVSGMNMQQIAVSMVGAINTDGRSTGVPLMMLLRSVMEEAQSLDDAERILTNAHRTLGYNYLVSDGKAPGARAFECSANKCAVFTDNDPKETVEYALPIDDAVFRADEAMDQEVRKTQVCSNGYPNMPYGSNSYDHRYKGMADRIKAQYGKIDDAAAVEIVKAVAMRNTNLHGFLANATDKVIYYAHAMGHEDAWKQNFIKFDLNDLFLRPENRSAPQQAAPQSTMSHPQVEVIELPPPPAK